MTLSSSIVSTALSTAATLGERAFVARDHELSLLHRATFGYTAEEHARVRSMGFHAWRDEQLDPDSIDDSAVDAVLAGFPSLTMDMATLLANYPPAANGDVTVRRELRGARVIRGAYSKRQLYERLVEFWTDHFNIDGNAGRLGYLKSVDDREVVREHALGNFRDLLGASAMSGAMLVYLDNFANEVGALNENYARELMELHTLGVDGGYTETDILEVARAFTGWTIYPQAHPNVGAFVFVNARHDNDPKTVLGNSLPAGGGQSDGETVLDILANHPSTAAFLSRKLCTFFLTYDPPQSTVDRVTETWTSTNGNITEVMREVLSHKSFAETRIGEALKLRRPLHMAIGAARTTNAVFTNFQGFGEELQLLGQVPYSWPAPNGYPDSLGAWGSNLLPRWGFASRLLDGLVPGVSVPDASILELLGGVPANEAAESLNRSLTGGRMSDVDVTELQEFIDAQGPLTPAVLRESIALALSLPSTQWL